MLRSRRFELHAPQVNLDDNDQHARDDRWLLVWQLMAKAAAESGGAMVQVVDEAQGLSAMQKAEEGIAKLLGLRVVRTAVAAAAR